MRRRHALLAAAGLAAGGARMLGRAAMPGSIVGTGSALGHLLRAGRLPEPTTFSTADVVVIGGGIAGLSAAWRLGRRGIDPVELIELEPEVGGNAASGANAVSAYPWGAHYVPTLTRESVRAAELFEEIGLITGHTAAGEPIYDELAQCADPHERLFLLGTWQEDLLPTLGVAAADRGEYRGFFAAIERFRAARGRDGRRAFAIPVDLSSADDEFRALDRLTMQDWMRQQGWTSRPLHWYVDYCCRDDFGAHAARTSAWAGIHYFAARSGRDDSPVLTWPEGNEYLVRQLKQRIGAAITANMLAWRVQPEAGGVTIDVYDPALQQTRRIAARAAVLATPRFVADRLLGQAGPGRFAYSPWMVANVTLDRLPGGNGTPLAWDNVIYDSPSLGYVVANHQSLERVRRGTVLTYYWPLCDAPPAQARAAALERSLFSWQEMVLGELLLLHPELEAAVRSVDVRVWGHGMIRPTPGTIWGSARAEASVQRPPVFFAHSDMSGISLFEEAHDRGVLAADAAADWLA